MARAFWKGTISFGLVSIPVRLFVGVATRPVELHLLHKKCLTRPKQVLRCEKDNEDISLKDTVRGYEYAKDQFIVLDEKDFAGIPLKTTRTIDILGFVRSNAIDPIYFNNTHYLEPDAPGVKPFLLLREALLATERVAVAKVAFQRREHLACLRPFEDSLILHTLYYNDEVLPRTELAPPKMEVKPEELDMAKSLIGVMVRDFNPEAYRDEYRTALQSLIEAKMRGQEIVAPKETPVAVPDLMAAMRASIEAARKSAAPEASGR
jgi:DNA end-binding protein Ku